MASGLHFVVLFGLACGLWIGADATLVAKPDECCQTCPPGWTQFGQGCYIFFNEEKNWVDAEYHCKEQKATLPTLHGNLHQSFRDYIHRVTGKHTPTWLGGFTAFKDVWLWDDGTNFDFKKWGSKNEPNGNKGEPGCMEMNYAGKSYVNDTKCDRKRPFFCGRKLVRPCHCCD